MTVRRWASVVLLAVLVILTIQNAHAIRVNVLFWGIEASQAIVIFVSFAAGAVAGLLVRGGRRSGATGSAARPPARS